MKKTTILLLTLMFSLTSAHAWEWDAAEVLKMTGLDISNQPNLKFWKLSKIERSRYIADNCLYKDMAKSRITFTCETYDMDWSDSRCNWSRPCPPAPEKVEVKGRSCYDSGYGYNMVSRIDSFKLNGKELDLGKPNALSRHANIWNLSDIGLRYGEIQASIVYFTTKPGTDINTSQIQLSDYFGEMTLSEDNRTYINGRSTIYEYDEDGKVINTKVLLLKCQLNDMPAPRIE